MAISRSCVCSVVWCPGVMRMVAQLCPPTTGRARGRRHVSYTLFCCRMLCVKRTAPVSRWAADEWNPCSQPDGKNASKRRAVTRDRETCRERGRRTTRRPRAPDERSLKRWYLSRHQRSNILTLCIILNPIQCSWDQLNSNRQHTVHRMSHDLFTVQISVCACGSSIRTEGQQRVAEEPEPWIRRDTSRRRNTPQQQVLRHPWAFPTLRLFCCPNFYSEASCKALHEKRGHVHVRLAVVPQ